MIITEKFARIAASHIEENLPSACLIMPFDPKMSPKTDIQDRLNAAYAQVKKELDLNYAADQSATTLKKLKAEIKRLNHSAHTKSICIFVSPDRQHTYYFNIEVKIKIILDQAFDIRDIVRSKPKNIAYLLLVLGAGSAAVFLKGSQQTPRLISRLPDRGNPESLMNQADSGLSILMESYSHPLFVLGIPEKLDHFKKTSRNTDMVVGYISSETAPASAAEVNHMLLPFIQDQDHILYLHVSNQLRRAEEAGKLARGVGEVHAMAGKINNRLLIVEKDCACQSVFEKTTDNDVGQIRDLVNETIQKVLNAGANVQFIEKRLLPRYKNIALIYD